MLRHILATALVAAGGIFTAEACTSLIATRGATENDAVMVTYAADSHTLYGELYHQPAADYPEGAMRKVYEWDTGKYLGEIPEVRHTYSTVGNMNEHGLTIAESTWGGRPELEGSGLIDYGSLIYITLQRAKTAREAVDIMTDLVKQYGYSSSGESFSIADPNEAWIMELIGKGKDDPGAVWVARRVPEGHISGHANHSRIHQFPLNEPATTIYSPDVIDFARSKGYFNGKDEDFSFSSAYAELDGSALRGCDGRVWSFYNKYNPDMGPYLDWILQGKGEPLPLWVKPSRKLSARDMQAMMRDHFEGTPMDMTLDIGAGPWKVPYRWRPMTYDVDSVTYYNERAIATQQTGFSFVSEMRADAPDAMRGVLWFGVDDANTCVYVPMYSCLTEVPHEFAPGNGDMLDLSWDAAFWVTNYVANQAYNRYSLMIPDIRRVQNSMEDSIAAEVDRLYATVGDMSPTVARSILNRHSADWSKKYVDGYKKLGDYLLVKYLDGNRKKTDEQGNFLRTPEGMAVSPDFPGYDEKYYRSIVNDPDGGDRLKLLIIEQKD
ncbi:MAG: dipeptidase [Bacteroides sp.]|nr:dipeptidase [Barnesiella sp.]MBD5314758.1 dipeptidase [Bacteroides sp.]